MTTSELKAELDKHSLDVPVEILLKDSGLEFEIESIHDRHYFVEGFKLTIVVKKKGGYVDGRL